jgi:hypothetical protein
VIIDNYYIGGVLQTNVAQAKFNFLNGPVSASDFTFTNKTPVIVGILASNLYARSSGKNPGRFTVSRTGSTKTDLIIDYNIHGTAINGKDYETIGSSITIPAGQITADILIKPLAEAFSGIKTVFLSLENLNLSTRWMLGPDYHAVVVISP